MRRSGTAIAFLGALVLLHSSCGGGGEGSSPSPQSPGGAGAPGSCGFVTDGPGPDGAVPLKAERIVNGLEVPWAIGFLPGGDLLVTERPGRVRLVRQNQLVPAPVLTLTVGEQGEGGLMGLAVDPGFASNRLFFVYYTAPGTPANENRLERYRLSDDGTAATLDRVILEDIPAGTFHNGGRLKFGPDGNLYLGTGDGREPERSQDPASRAGKILRISPDGSTVENFALGVRNVQGFDWLDDPSTMLVTDHGPTGELGLSGRDEVSLARAGDNLGWPRITACESGAGLVTPFIAWEEALPPGGAIVYRGGLIPGLSGSVLVAALGGQQLHRINLDGTHESYLRGAQGFGRLREIVTAPDGAILVTTSNCDGRGRCGAEKDSIVRISGPAAGP